MNYDLLSRVNDGMTPCTLLLCSCNESTPFTQIYDDPTLQSSIFRKICV